MTPADRSLEDAVHAARPSTDRDGAGTLLGSLVIPVYNEEREIDRLLGALSEGGRLPKDLRVVVACNGCTDRSAEVARSHAGAIVAELPQASKTDALNLGDELAGDVFPRLYIDGDLHIDIGSVRLLLDALHHAESPLAVGPTSRFLTEGKPWSVRSFYFTLDHLPKHLDWQRTHLGGRGVYGTNRSGRAHFDQFPDVRNDDAFFDLIYDESERRVVEDAVAGIDVADTTRQLVRIFTRVHDGNLELRGWLAEHRPDRSLWSTPTNESRTVRLRAYLGHLQLGRTLMAFRRPRSFAMLLTYIGLRTVIWVRFSWRRWRGREIGWR